jgi:carotenoid cleavage dioxygenase-like enzyme
MHLVYRSVMTALEEHPAEINPYLDGVFAPVTTEIEAAELSVLGDLPTALDGVYLRNGPNPQFEPSGRYHWFDGDGMVHAVEIHGGTASYRNRWVQTPGLRHERGAGRSLFGGLADLRFPPAELIEECGLLKNAANTNIVRHAGSYLALWEGGWPTVIERDLSTVGLSDYDGRLEGPMTAHPKWCPETGELVFFGYVAVGGPPHLRYHVADASGRLIHSAPITLPRAVMMHDFVTTRRHSVFFDLPAVIGPGSGDGMWQPQHGARIGVLPRHGGDADVRWFEIEPCYVFHFLNAWETGDVITVHGCRLPSADLVAADGFVETGAGGSRGVGLTRWTVDLAAGTCTEERLSDLRSDFPRLHDDRLGLPHRYGYASAPLDPSDQPVGFNGLVRYDLQTGREDTYAFGPGSLIGEAVFAADPDGAEEIDGWLLVYATDLATDRTDLCVIDARDFEAGPVARIHIPQRVPMGFHGNWLPDA